MTGRMQLLRRYATRLGVSTTRIAVTARAGAADARGRRRPIPIPTLDEFILLHRVVHAAVSAHPDILSMVDGARRAFGWNVLGARPAASPVHGLGGAARAPRTRVQEAGCMPHSCSMSSVACGSHARRRVFCVAQRKCEQSMSGHFHVFLALAHCLRTKTRGNFWLQRDGRAFWTCAWQPAAAGTDTAGLLSLITLWRPRRQPNRHGRPGLCAGLGGRAAFHGAPGGHAPALQGSVCRRV